MEAIRRYAGDRTRGKLFDMSVNTVYWLVRRYAKMSGFKDWQRVHLHRLRHTGASEFFKLAGESDGGLVKTMTLLGHRDIKTTMRYVARSRVEDLAEVARKMTDA